MKAKAPAKKAGQSRQSIKKKPAAPKKKPIAKKPVVTKKPAKKTAIEKAPSTIEKQMESFLVQLRKHHGNVSKAVDASKLPRSTAYARRTSDPEFAARWAAADEAGNDDLHAVAVTRATRTKDPSDTLLIYLMKRGDQRTKIRQKLVQAGNLALKAVQNTGKDIGLSPEQIMQLEDAIITNLNHVHI